VKSFETFKIVESSFGRLLCRGIESEKSWKKVGIVGLRERSPKDVIGSIKTNLWDFLGSAIPFFIKPINTVFYASAIFTKKVIGMQKLGIGWKKAS
jgi:hypothetical protein